MHKNFFFYMLPTVTIGILSTFVMVPVTTYYLDPKDFGIIAILSAFTMPIGPLASTGVSWVLGSNYYVIDESERKSLMFNVLLLDFGLKTFWVALFWFTASTLLPLIVKDFDPRYIFYFKLLLISTLLNAFWPSISFLIVLQNKGNLHALLEVTQWTAGALAAIIGLVYFKLTIIVLFLIPLASAAISLVTSLWYVRKHIRPGIKRKWLIEIFKVGMPTIPSSSLEVLANITDRYFIQRWLSLSQLGIYSHSLSYRNIFAMCSRTFSKTLAPSMLETFTKGLDAKYLKESIAIWYGLLGLAGVFVSLYSYEIVNILTHGKFVAAAPLIPLWFLILLSFTYGMPYTNFLVAHKKNSFLAYSFIVVCSLFIGITAFAVYAYGLIGGVISIVSSNLVIHLSKRIYARKLGCMILAEKEFLFIMAILLAFVIAVTVMNISLFWKTLIFVLSSSLIIYKFNLTSTFRVFRRIASTQPTV
jgi:O-antigen/teichoic acid export membrane protein